MGLVMSSPNLKQNDFPLAVIGDGYAAAVLLIHLAKHGFDLNQVVVIGKGQLGLGAAYGTEHPDFRLNVRDDLMIIDDDNPDDFVNWASQLNDPDAEDSQGGGKFYRRRDFADYIRHQLQKYDIKTHITRIKAHVQRITRGDHGHWIITLDHGDKVTVKAAVLATGNPPPNSAHLISPTAPADRIIRTPWGGQSINNIAPDDHLLLIGGGLTALDACLALYQAKHRGKLTLVTPRGLLPPRQRMWAKVIIPEFPTPLTASRFFQHIRRHLPDESPDTSQWQSAFEGVRAVMAISGAWSRLSPQCRRRLITRLGWLWSLMRYRAAPQAIDAVEDMLNRGQMTIISDRVVGITSGAPLKVKLSQRHPIDCDIAYLASGPGIDTLIQHLISDGIGASPFAKADQDKFGLAVGDDLCLLTDDGISAETLWAIGTPTMASRGDVVGASSIARQAASLAQRLCTNFAPIKALKKRL
jgi:uncharacterized NAD(P)/FAD-binding protein YdhS